MKYKFKRKPRSYQLAALQKLLKLGVLALWFDPGLGKTKVAIDFTGIKRMTEDVRKVLVVCPLSAVGVWEDEFPIDLPADITMSVIPVVGDMEDRIEIVKKAMLSDTPTVLIMNYDSLRYKRDAKKALKEDVILKLMIKWQPQILILDEMHYTKNHASQRSKAVYNVRQAAKYVVGLTGTPIPKNPLDIFGQYKILAEDIFGSNYTRFKDRYAVPHYKFPSKIIDWKNLDEMAEKVHSIAYRVRDDECKTLPELIVQDIPVYFSEKSKKIYKQMADEMVAELDNMETVTAAMAAVKVGKLQQITGGFLMRTDTFMQDGKPVQQQVSFPVGTEKLDVFMDLIDRYIENHKILVGCRFIWEINQIEARLAKAGIEYVTIKGGVSAEARTEAKRRYQTDDKLRVIIFQVSAATAMTLTAGDIGILYSCTRKWDDYWQWLKRIHREGQTKPVYILRLIVKGTVDREVIKSLEEKREFTDVMVDKSNFRDMLRPKF